MTAPEPESLGYRHIRTASGLLFMLAAVGLVFYEFFLDGRTKEVCVNSWMDFAHDYAFPGAMFLSGLMLFNRMAFGDLMSTAKGFIPGQK